MYIGGIRALLLQSLHPLAMAGVAGHSEYQDDPWGRLQRTADYVAMTELSWVLFLLVFERIRDMSKRYSQDFKDRAVRLLSDRLAADRSCSQWQAVREIAPKLGIANESLRRWYEQHLVNTGERQGMTREEHEEIKRLKREVAQLRRANEILKTASAFFAAELDRPAR